MCIRKKGGKQKKSKRRLIEEKFLFRSFSWKIPAALFLKRKAKSHQGNGKDLALCDTVNHTSSRHVSGQPGCKQVAYGTEQEVINCMAYQVRSQHGVSALLWPQAGSRRGRRESTPKQEEARVRLQLWGKPRERGAIGETCAGMHCLHQGKDDCATEEIPSLCSLRNGECCKIKTPFLPSLPKCTD